ncbi:MAG: class I SAM-dependent methyltransferase [Candidatus Woesearchaeota archaeon]
MASNYDETKAFSYLAKVSDEKQLQLANVLSVAKDLKQKRLFLDIGAGAGDTFFRTAAKFERSVAVEPGERMFRILCERKKKHPLLDAKLIKSTWENFYATNSKKYKNSFDLITCIHTVYFFKDMKKAIAQMLGLLAEDGKLIIISIYGKNMKKSFIHYFRHKMIGNPLKDEAECSKIKKMFPKNCKAKIIETTMKLSPIEKLEINHLSPKTTPTNFYFRFIFKKWFDEFAPKEKEEMKKFMKRFRKKDGKHILKEKQWFYVLSKHAGSRK